MNLSPDNASELQEIKEELHAIQRQVTELNKNTRELIKLLIGFGFAIVFFLFLTWTTVLKM